MTAAAEKKYIPGLDALRAIACLSVMLFHFDFFSKTNTFNAPFKGGFFGVDLFFVLSGYLITSILINQYVKYSTISFKSFYIKRILRLYPPILISVIVFFVPLLFTDTINAISNIVSLMTYTGDCAMLVQYFTHLPYPLLSGHSWSLAVEEQFYLTFPVLLFLVLRLITRKKLRDIISFFPVFLVIYCAVIIVSTRLLGLWFYKFFVWRFFEIYLGAFIAIIYSKSYQSIAQETPMSKTIKNIVYKAYSNSLVLLFSLFFTLGMLVFPRWIPFLSYLQANNMQYVLFTLTSSVLIVNMVYSYHPIYSKIFSNKVLVSIGKFSYGLYLYTPFISYNIKRIFFDNPPKFSKAALTSNIISMIVSLAFSYLSYVLIEKNILKLKHRFEPENQNYGSERPGQARPNAIVVGDL